MRYFRAKVILLLVVAACAEVDNEPTALSSTHESAPADIIEKPIVNPQPPLVPPKEEVRAWPASKTDIP